MTAPKRIQRSRTKGWRLPKGAIYVAYPTLWRTPFDWMTYGRTEAVALYRAWLTGAEHVEGWEQIHRQAIAMMATLRGHDLCCGCPLDQPCHADVLLELANADPADMTCRARAAGIEVMEVASDDR